MIPRIKHEIATDLQREEWSYYLMEKDMCLVLDEYTRFERPTKRHGWKDVAKWRRLVHRRHEEMHREDVPVPDEVRAEVLRKLRDMITIEG
jgi:hypothetical protein